MIVKEVPVIAIITTKGKLGAYKSIMSALCLTLTLSRGRKQEFSTVDLLQIRYDWTTPSHYLYQCGIIAN